ncbi:MAG: hypothetical protein R3D71_04555 [Rickettsiales bacterium]
MTNINSFSGYPPINFNVKHIEIVDSYTPDKNSNLEYEMPYSPTMAIKTWANSRLNAAGKDDLLQVMIHKASATEIKKPKEKGISAAFKNNDSIYEIKIEVELRVYGGGAISDANAIANVSNSMTIPASYNVIERTNAYMSLLNKSMSMVNDKMEENISKYMNNYLAIY